jgi:hypothetical protein
MRLYYDAAKSKEMQDKLVRYWEEQKHERDKNLHVYDMANCEVMAYQRLFGIEREYTKEMAGLMIFGIIGGQVIQMMYPKDEQEYECDLEKLIFAHLDVFDNKVYPLEIKSTRKQIFKKDQIPDYWVQQLMCYLTITKKHKGHLIFLNVFTNQISVFTLEMADEELMAFHLYLIEKAHKILESVSKKDANSLGISPEQFNICGYKKKCPRASECRAASLILKKQKETATK